MNQEAHAPESCTRCSYPLQGLAPDTPCPECGLTRQAVDRFLICPHCSYQLAGLKQDMSCPECGKPVSDAIVEFPLFRSGAAYVRRIASGASLVMIAAYMAVGAVLVMLGSGFILPFFSRATGGMAAGMNGFLLLMLVYFLLIIGSGIVWLVGWIRATPRDPVYKGSVPSDTPRAPTRGLAIAVFSSCFFLWIPFLGFIAFIAQTVCFVAMFFYASVYIREIARRIPSPRLERSARRLNITGAWLCAAFGLCFILGFVIASSSTSSAGDIVSSLLFLTCFILFLAMLLVYLRLVSSFAKTMKQIRRRTAEMPAVIE